MLSEKRHVTVILRLVLDAQGRLERGEIVAAEGTLQGRFMGWHGLIRTLRTWLSRQEHEGVPEAPGLATNSMQSVTSHPIDLELLPKVDLRPTVLPKYVGFIFLKLSAVVRLDRTDRGTEVPADELMQVNKADLPIYTVLGPAYREA